MHRFTTKDEYLQDYRQDDYLLQNIFPNHQDPGKSFALVKAKDNYFTSLDRKRINEATLHVWLEN